MQASLAASPGSKHSSNIRDFSFQFVQYRRLFLSIRKQFNQSLNESIHKPRYWKFRSNFEASLEKLHVHKLKFSICELFAEC